MKPTEIKKATLLLNKKSIANLTSSEMSLVQGGLLIKPPSNTTDNGTWDFPVTLYCYTTVVVLTAGTRPYSETC
jgi:hypothetical protein